MTATSPTTGDQAFVSANSGLYIFNGGGWYKIATVNTSPTISSPSSGANNTLATDGTATSIELVGSDTDPGTTYKTAMRSRQVLLLMEEEPRRLSRHLRLLVELILH